jgi:hypothetical protein
MQKHMLSKTATKVSKDMDKSSNRRKKLTKK